MQSRFPMKYVLLLLGILFGSAYADETATEPLPSEPQAEGAAVIRKGMLFIPLQGQEEVLRSFFYNPAAHTDVSNAAVNQGLVSAQSLGYGPGIGIAGGAIAALLLTSGKEPPKYSCLPPMMPGSAPKKHFTEIYKALESGTLIQSLNAVTEASFTGKGWYDSIEISRLEGDVKKDRLIKPLQKQQWNRTLPDTAFAVKNSFVFHPDYYRLWVITELQSYEVRANSRKGPLKVESSREDTFVSLYDLRDHFEIALAEIPEHQPSRKFGKNKDVNPNRPREERDLPCCRREIAAAWSKDDGKLFFDTVLELAAQNSKMIRHFLQQAPDANSQKTESATVMALYQKPEAPEDAEAPEKEISREKLEKMERARWKMDGGVMEKMNTAQRKAYMLGKEHEGACVVDLIETAPDRVMARDRDVNIYYSVPTKNISLVKESQINPDEYKHMVDEYAGKKSDPETTKEEEPAPVAAQE
jgi:hypothetical protein